MQSLHVFVLSLVVILSSCSKSSEGDSKSAPASDEATAASADKVAAKAPTASSTNPCEILTEAMVRKHVKLADDVELNQRLSEPGGHPHCSYNWSTLSEEEEKQRNAEMAKRMMEKAKAKGKSQTIVDMAMSKNSGRGSAHLTMTKEMKSEEAAVGALKSARTFMENRAKAKVAGEDVDFTSPFVDVEGIGAKAHYSTKQRQLSYAAGNRLFHLGVTPHDEQDAKELAMAVAQDILK